MRTRVIVILAVCHLSMAAIIFYFTNSAAVVFIVSMIVALTVLIAAGLGLKWLVLWSGERLSSADRKRQDERNSRVTAMARRGVGA